MKARGGMGQTWSPSYFLKKKAEAGQKRQFFPSVIKKAIFFSEYKGSPSQKIAIHTPSLSFPIVGEKGTTFSPRFSLAHSKIGPFQHLYKQSILYLFGWYWWSTSEESIAHP